MKSLSSITALISNITPNTKMPLAYLTLVIFSKDGSRVSALLTAFHLSSIK